MGFMRIIDDEVRPRQQVTITLPVELVDWLRVYGREQEMNRSQAIELALLFLKGREETGL